MLREVAAGARNLTVEECAYTPCYCEENVYLLCKELVRRGLAAPDASDLLVAFISNSFKMVGPAPQVWDLDSNLPFPVAAPQYVHQALQGGGTTPLELTPEFVRLFRVVSGPQFMREFASDRSHMRDDFGGWLKPPPPYSPIIGQGGETNTMPKYAQITESMVCAICSHVQDAYISHLETKPYGEVVSESDFCCLLGVQI